MWVLVHGLGLADVVAALNRRLFAAPVFAYPSGRLRGPARLVLDVVGAAIDAGELRREVRRELILQTLRTVGF